jgi:hypothetical protein
LYVARQICIARSIGPAVDDRSGKRIVVDPLEHSKALDPDRSYEPPSIDVFLSVDDAEEGSDKRALIVAANFAPPLDQHRTEKPIGGQARQDEGAVSGFEYL